MAREMFGLSLGFLALILLAANAEGADHGDITLRSQPPIAAEATLPAAPM
jgi:hypothetical protein